MTPGPLGQAGGVPGSSYLKTPPLSDPTKITLPLSLIASCCPNAAPSTRSVAFNCVVSVSGVPDCQPFDGLTKTYASPPLLPSNAAPITPVSPALSTAAAYPKPPFSFASELRSLADSIIGSETLVQPPDAEGSRKTYASPSKDLPPNDPAATVLPSGLMPRPNPKLSNGATSSGSSCAVSLAFFQALPGRTYTFTWPIPEVGLNSWATMMSPPPSMPIESAKKSPMVPPLAVSIAA